LANRLEKDKAIEKLLKKRNPLAAKKDPGPAADSHETGEDVVPRSEYDVLLADVKHIRNVLSFYKAIIQNMSSGLLSVDLKGNITFFNKGALEILKYKGEDIIEKPVISLCGEDHLSRDLLSEVVANRLAMDGKELRLVDGTGSYIRIGFSSTPLHDENNNHEGMILIFRDLTEILEMRQQMQRMERLATLGELSAGIAHEIRNPLAGIKASAQVLQESFDGNDFRGELVTRIVKEIDRSNELLKEFFKFAKPSKPHRSFYDVEMIIDGVYLLLAPRLKKRRISFGKKIRDEIRQIYVDENQIEQVFLNLFLNSIDALPDGGKIEIGIGMAHMSVSNLKKGKITKRQVQAVEVLVLDNGTGIESDLLEKIFNPFFTTKSDGLGLGLSISNRLITENGGKMEVESTPGEKTMFRLLLPVNKV
jgi:PAS domain S-box-containing protein